jgi:alpha-L-arabinofuranosidase
MQAIDTKVHLEGVSGVASIAREMLLAGAKEDKNSISEPECIAPTTQYLNVGKVFESRLPAISVQVIRIGIME